MWIVSKLAKKLIRTVQISISKSIAKRKASGGNLYQVSENLWNEARFNIVAQSHSILIYFRRQRRVNNI